MAEIFIRRVGRDHLDLKFFGRVPWNADDFMQGHGLIAVQEPN